MINVIETCASLLWRQVVVSQRMSISMDGGAQERKVRVAFAPALLPTAAQASRYISLAIKHLFESRNTPVHAAGSKSERRALFGLLGIFLLRRLMSRARTPRDRNARPGVQILLLFVGTCLASGQNGLGRPHLPLTLPTAAHHPDQSDASLSQSPQRHKLSNRRRTSNSHCLDEYPLQQMYESCTTKILADAAQVSPGVASQVLVASNGTVTSRSLRGARWSNGAIYPSNDSCLPPTSTAAVQSGAEVRPSTPVVGVLLQTDDWPAAPTIGKPPSGASNFLAMLLAVELIRTLTAAAVIPPRPPAHTNPIRIRDPEGSQNRTRALITEQDVYEWLSVLPFDSQSHPVASPLAIVLACVIEGGQGGGQPLAEETLRMVTQLYGVQQTAQLQATLCASVAPDSSTHGPTTTSSSDITYAQIALGRLPLFQTGFTQQKPPGKHTCARESRMWQNMRAYLRAAHGVVFFAPSSIAVWPTTKAGFPVGDHITALVHVAGHEQQNSEYVAQRVNALHEMAAYRRVTLHCIVVDLSRLPLASVVALASKSDAIVAFGRLPLQSMLFLPDWGGVFEVFDVTPDKLGNAQLVSNLLGLVFATFHPAQRAAASSATNAAPELRVAKLQSGFGDVLQLVQQRRRDRFRQASHRQLHVVSSEKVKQ